MRKPKNLVSITHAGYQFWCRKCQKYQTIDRLPKVGDEVICDDCETVHIVVSLPNPKNNSTLYRCM